MKSGKTPTDIQSLKLDQVLELYKEYANDNAFKCDPYEHVKVCKNKKSSTLPAIAVKLNSQLPDAALDTQVMRLAFDKGAFKKSAVRYSDHEGKIVSVVPVDPRYAKLAKDLYRSADKAASDASKDPSSAFEFGTLTKTAATRRTFTEVAAVPVTKVAIGNPHPIPAKEKKLVIEPSILKKYDVYWLELAINPREDLKSTVEEVLFSTSLKTEDAKALNLVPLRYGEERTIKEQTGIPEIKLEGEGVGVSVGQVYSQEVTYKSLKPTIVGTGLQSAEFGWAIRDDMLDMSAKRLIAIIGVPKGAAQLELQMVVTMKTKGRYLGSYRAT